MATTYSSTLGFALMATGENSGTWGTTTNTNLSPLIESSICGRTTASFTSDANLTISITDGVDSTGRYYILNCTSVGSLTATRDLICPLRAGKTYLVYNATSGSQSIRVIGSSGTGITVPNGNKAFVYCDGTNFVQAIDWLGALTLGGAFSGTTGTFSSTLGVTGTLTGAAANFSGTVVATQTSNAANIEVLSAKNAGSGGGTSASLGFYAAGSKYAEIIGGYPNGPGFMFNVSGGLVANLTATGFGVSGGNLPNYNFLAYTTGSTKSGFQAGNSNTGAGSTNGAFFGVDTTGNADIDFGSALPLLFKATGTEVMRLTQAGLLGIGMTPARTLDVTGTFGVTGAATFNGRITQSLTASAAEYALKSSGQTTGWIAIEMANTGGSYIIAGENSTGNNLITGDSAYDMVIRGPSGIAFSANAGTTQHMRLTSAGLLGIGMTPTSGVGTVQATVDASLYAFTGYRSGSNVGQGFYSNVVALQNSSSTMVPYAAIGGNIATSTAGSHTGNLIFAVAQAGAITEVGRIDSSGRLLLNTTATISIDRNEAAFPGSTTNGFGFNDTSATTGSNFLVFRSNGTAIGTISNNANTGVLYNVTSDKELKDFVSVHDNGDILDRVEWNDFTWKSHPDNGIKVGAFAQDIYKVVPDVVTPGRGAVGEEDFIPWQVDYTGLVPYLGAEVKSLRARVATLEARLTALENK